MAACRLEYKTLNLKFYRNDGEFNKLVVFSSSITRPGLKRQPQIWDVYSLKISKRSPRYLLQEAGKGRHYGLQMLGNARVFATIFSDLKPQAIKEQQAFPLSFYCLTLVMRCVQQSGKNKDSIIWLEAPRSLKHKGKIVEKWEIKWVIP